MGAVSVPNSKEHTNTRPKIWWSNTIFFVGVHVAALFGMYYYPPTAVPWSTLGFAFVSWQLAEFGITVGYHRLYSHRSYRATFAVRAVLAVLGTTGFQGSIKWWCLRHRLHHAYRAKPPFQRFTDDLIHDPYAATRGLFYSHLGWIFYKPTYERMDIVDKDDLEADPVVRFQHKYYVSMAIFLGFVLPPAIGHLWGDAKGSFIWVGLVSRVMTWHCTFLVNSLAHWDGLQPYSDEDTSRGNIILALLTGGEGNHNFHAFPHDYRSGPSYFDWDPSKWIIAALHKLGLATGLRRARECDMKEALLFMHNKTHQGIVANDDSKPWTGPTWNMQDAVNYLSQKPGRCLVVVNGYVVDVTTYLGEHPGGSALLRKYSIRPKAEVSLWRDATWAFEGGLNQHSRAAKSQMQELRVAKWIELD